MQPCPHLAAVVADPSADAPRLVCADWYEANGDPARGELIRVQVGLAARPAARGPARRRLRQRQRDLLKANSARWLAELPALEGIEWLNSFERGFVDHISLKGRNVLKKHATTLFGSAPVRAVSLYAHHQGDYRDVLEVADEYPLLRLQITRARGFSDRQAQELAEARGLRSLVELRLYDNEIGEAGAAALASSPHLANLRLLDLIQNPLWPGGVRALAASQSLPSLRSLQLYGVKQDLPSTLELLASPLARQLRSLGIGGAFELDDRVAAAIDRGHFLFLRSLDLNNTSLGDAGLMILAQSSALPRLRELHLRSAGLGDPAVVTLAHSPLARRLRHLDIENSDVTNLGAWELVESPHLGRLRELKMWDDDNLTDPVCLALKKRFGKRVDVHVDDPEPKWKDARHVWRPTNGFLEDIRANPDDDTPRLVYADWLDEHDDAARAEFIRVQCELARLGEDDPRRSALQAREAELLTAYGRAWTTGAFLAWLDHPEGRCPIAQPHEVCTVFADVLRLQEELEAPGLSKADKARIRQKIKRRQARCGRLDFAEEDCTMPLFEEYTFRRGFLDAVVVPEIMFFLFAPAVRDLGMVRDLKVLMDDDDREIGDTVVDNVIATMGAPRLLRLALHCSLDERDTVRALALWPGLSEVRTFAGLMLPEDIERSGGEVADLTDSPHLGNLEELDVYVRTNPGDAGVEALIRSPSIRRLRDVRLEDGGPISPPVQEKFKARFPGATYRY